LIEFTGSTYEIINAKEVTSIFLYELHYSTSEDPLYWTSYDEDVTFNSTVYTKFPITHDTINENSDGEIQEVTVRVANADRAVQYYVENYSLMWKKFVIKEIFIGTSEYLTYNFLIKSCKCTKSIATFILSSGIDILGLVIPNRKMIQNYCPWTFKDSNCLYSGSDTVCEKTFNDCKKKDNLNNYGGFPAMISNNFYI